VRAWAATDGFATPWDRVPLESGPGRWVGSAGRRAAGYQWPARRPYVLTAPGQFRPPPPPAFGSRSRTASPPSASRGDARPAGDGHRDFWNADGAGDWIDRGAEFITAAGLDEREAAGVRRASGRVFDATSAASRRSRESSVLACRRRWIRGSRSPSGHRVARTSCPTTRRRNRRGTPADGRCGDRPGRYFPAHAARARALVAEQGCRACTAGSTTRSTSRPGRRWGRRPRGGPSRTTRRRTARALGQPALAAAGEARRLSAREGAGTARRPV
jgi:hypothetical protein